MTVRSRVAWALTTSLLAPLAWGDEPFESVRSRMSAAKAGLMEKQKGLLAERHDLSNRPSGDATMFRGKAVQGGVRAKLPAGVT